MSMRLLSGSRRWPGAAVSVSSSRGGGNFDPCFTDATEENLYEIINEPNDKDKLQGSHRNRA
jgi:inosine/xanthosine triphosphate pyrophosphatase family protein